METVNTALTKLFPYAVFRFIYGQASGTVPEASFPYTNLRLDAEKTPKNLVNAVVNQYGYANHISSSPRS